MNLRKYPNLKKDGLYLLLVCIVSYALSQTVVIDKEEYAFFLSNLLFIKELDATFKLSVCILAVTFFIHCFKICNISLLRSLFFSTVGLIFCFYLATIIFSSGLSIAAVIDNQKTSLGWEFKYIWTIVPLTALLLFMSTYLLKPAKK